MQHRLYGNGSGLPQESLTGLDLAEGFCFRACCKRQLWKQRQLVIDWVPLDGKYRSEAGTRFCQENLLAHLLEYAWHVGGQISSTWNPRSSLSLSSHYLISSLGTVVSSYIALCCLEGWLHLFLKGSGDSQFPRWFLCISVLMIWQKRLSLIDCTSSVLGVLQL